MATRKNSVKIIDMNDLAFARDKKKAGDELKNYFVNKNRQIKAAELVSVLKSSLKKRLFSSSEAKSLVEYLAKKFDIRRPAIQYAQAGYLSPVSQANKRHEVLEIKRSNHRSTAPSEDFFHQLFMRLQSAVQDNLLEYNGARVLVRDIVDHYPVTKDRLNR
jgi:hypothetical protein